MSATNNKIQYAIETKEIFKNKIEAMGVSIPEGVPFRGYADFIGLNGGGGGSNPLTISTNEAMEALLTSENIGKVVLYTGEAGTYEAETYYLIRQANGGSIYFEKLITNVEIRLQLNGDY